MERAESETNGGAAFSSSLETQPDEVSDDRNDLHEGEPVLLIVEDDAVFARILLDRARERGFKGVVVSRGGAVLAAANRFRPVAITLDIGLPDVDGWTVLDRLKHDPNTRHIPVHIISGAEERRRGLRQARSPTCANR